MASLRHNLLRSIGAKRTRSFNFYLLSGFIVLIFAIGGSSAADSQSVVVLRPVAALLCGYGFYSLKREQYDRYRVLFWLMGATIALCLIHLIPLPPVLWQSLPGRGIVVDVDRAIGLMNPWRPLSMVPYGTRNALFSLLIPLGTLLLASKLDRSEREALLPLLICIAMISGFLGFLQVLGGDESSFYFYSQRNNGSAVGLFANRNHSAVFLACLFPMLAMFACRPTASPRRARIQLWLAVIGGLVLIPTLIASGSRAAILVALPALISVPLLYRRSSSRVRGKRKGVRPGTRRGIYIAGIVGAIVAAVLIAVAAQRSEIVGRFLLLGAGDDLRFRVWGGIVEDIRRFFPLGSGVGSFVEVYQLYEPDDLMRPSYLNHAHNDLLEVALTVGLPGLLLVAVALIGWARGTFSAWRVGDKGGENAFARMASVVLFMLFLASLTDYPLRTPSLACFGVLAAVWLVARARSRS